MLNSLNNLRNKTTPRSPLGRRHVFFDIANPFDFNSPFKTTTIRFLTSCDTSIKGVFTSTNSYIKLKAGKMETFLRGVFTASSTIRILSNANVRIHVDNVMRPAVIKFKDVADATSKIGSQFESVVIRILVHSGDIVKNIARGQEKIKILVNGMAQSKFPMLTNMKMKFVHSPSDIVTKAHGLGSEAFNLLTDVAILSKNQMSTYVSKVKIVGTKAVTAIYRPAYIQTLYPQKIEDWYDLSLEQIFVGQVLDP